MTTPDPLNTGGGAYAYEKRRKIWLNRYLAIQARSDTRVRTALLQAAEDAENRLSALETNSTFSAGVRSAQIRLAMTAIRDVHESLFKQMIPIIKDGYVRAAGAATDALAESDTQYLRAAFKSTGAASLFVDGQRRQAEIGVVHAINSLTKSDIPLSARVYRSRSISNGWAKRVVVSTIMRGGSAREIAQQVRSHIRPNTPGGTSYAAMRLGRTELNNAFHATTIELTKDRPWVESNRWNLSNTHVPQKCKCETYARIGTFSVENTPVKPHPQCRCFVTPELEPFESFVTNLNAGYYRDWTSKHAA